MRSLQTESDLKHRLHHMPFGASVTSSGDIRFQLAAPTAKTVDLLLHADKSKIKLPLEKLGEGRFELLTKEASVGSNYQFLIDGETAVPDPASRYQLDTVHGPSQVIDPLSYKWTEASWKGRSWEEAVIYELHVGTFSEQGTFAAIEDKLDHLVQLGVTAIELMPIADFPGKRNWGYDGVLFYAPANNYGSPNQLKHLIDICHQKGLMVFLDVVYNHFGPEGNYLHAYASSFFNEKHKTPWGAALNYDGENSSLLREFVLNNALYWLNEFFFDGLRLDAVHAICDSSTNHIIDEICDAIAIGPGAERQVHIILENDNNQAKFLLRDRSPLSATAQWNDDIHHVFHVICSGEKEAYYSDYADSLSSVDLNDSTLGKLGKSLLEGFVFQGQPSPYRKGEPKGEVSKDLPSTAFISFLQNHDQVGNRAFGERLWSVANPNTLKVMTAVFLLAPEIPMLFMGEEWAASSPFLYFCDLGPELAPLVTAGRRKEFQNFSMFRDEKQRESIPDPCAENTYLQSKLKWQEKEIADHQQWLSYYKDLLSLRKKHIVPLLKDLKPGLGQFAVLPGNILTVAWLLEDGRYLRLIVNPSHGSVSAETKSIFSNSAQIIFQQPGDLSQNLLSGSISPYSVVWYLK